MISYGTAFYELRIALHALYDAGEANAIAHLLLEHISGMGKMERLMQKDMPLPDEQAARYEQAVRGLLEGRPLQYVVGKAWFLGREYTVNEQVLIPRPETEELVDWIIKDHQDTQELSILDIGSGSGCIPISLKLAMPQALVKSCDISEGAIAVAEENARNLAAAVAFIRTDFLNHKMWYNFEQYDVIVSNPPYIPQSEADKLHINVAKYEPELALFVPEDDALLFYRNIAEFGKEHLKRDGAIYCELHKDHAAETEQMFAGRGYKTELRKDMNGNERMIKAVLDHHSSD